MMTGDPSRRRGLAVLNGLNWQTSLNAKIDPKGLFAALANHVVEAEHGGFTVGLDGAGPFRTRPVAEAMAALLVEDANG